MNLSSARTLGLTVVLLLSALLPAPVWAQVNHPSCLEQGGPYVCTPLQVTPWTHSSGLTIDRADLSDWRAECHGRGGVIGDSDGDGVLDCTGAAAWTAENIVSMSQAIAGEWFSSCGLTGGSTDSGWGFTGYSSVCAADYRKRFDGGVELIQCRWLTFEGIKKGFNRDGPGYGCEWGQAHNAQFFAARTRQVTCPIGYSILSDSSGRKVGCYRKQPADCPVNNPVVLAEFKKVLTERDHVSDGLEFTRYWDQASFYSVAGQTEEFDPLNGRTLGAGWRHNYDRRLYAYAGSTNAMAGVRAADGKIRVFDWQGKRLQAWEDGTEHLLRLSDDAGMTVGWQLRNARNELEHYDASGHLTAIDRPGQGSLQLDYDGAGRLLRVTDQQGRGLLFEYAEDTGLLQTLYLPDGGAIGYRQDARGLLTDVIHADQSSRHYVYTDKGYLSDIYDETGGRYGHNEYLSNGQIRSTVAGPDMPGGGVNRYEYGGGWLDPVVTGPTGNTVAYRIRRVAGMLKIYSRTEGCETCGSRKRETRYDANGYPRYENDFQDVLTERKYDDHGRLWESIYASNRPAQKKTVQTDWHADFGSPVERRVFAADGALVAKSAWRYNARGQVLAQEQHDPLGGPSRVTTTTYCEQPDIDAGRCPLPGLVTSVDGPRTDVNDVTTYTYYPQDHADCAASPTTCRYRKGDLWKVTNALGHVTEILFYDGAGRVLSARDPNGVITQYLYHPRGWLTARKVRGPNSGTETDDAITRIEYWPTGLVKKVTQPDGSFTTYTYDAAHRLTDIGDNLGNSIHYTLDNAGNRTREDTLGADGELLRTLSRVYDQLGQLKTAKDAYAHATGFTYDASGNLDTVTDAAGTVTDNDYDPLDRLTRTLQDVAGIQAETKFEYDALDNLTKVTDPKGLDTIYTYNGLGDLTQLTSPDTGTTTYTYDSAGNRSTQTDARGRTATYRYDALNRLTGIAYATATLDVTYTYDTANAVCEPHERFARGRLTRMQDGSGSTEYCYDRFGNLTRKVQTTNGVTLTTRYGHDLTGKPLSMVYPSGARVDYAYNANGQPSGVSVTRPGSPQEVLLSAVTYYPFGPAAELRYGDGRALRRTLDRNYQPGIVQDVGPGGLSLGYEFDEVGNLAVLRSGDQAEPPLRRFDYDALGRLAETQDGATGSVLQAYGYDATGNRTAMTAGAPTAYTYATTSHRLSRVGSTNRWYDSTGNTVSIGGTAREFVYDATNRLSQAKANGVVAMNYRYNGKGERVRRWNGSTSTASVYDEAGRWLGDYDGSGGRIQEVIWLDDPGSGPGQALPVGLIANDETAANDRLYYIEADHLGTPRVVIDPVREQPVWTWPLTGEAFGAEPPNEDPDADGIAFVFDMRFPGQRYDQASGLNYNYFRDYEPATGRYAQSDPIGLLGGANTYNYGVANSLLYYDPYGLWSWGDELPTWLVDGAAGMGDTLSFGGTGVVRRWMGTDDVVDRCSSAYSNGEWGGIGLSLAFGGAHLGRNALYQMGRAGGMGARLSRGGRRLFADGRTWGAVRDTGVLLPAAASGGWQ